MLACYGCQEQGERHGQTRLDLVIGHPKVTEDGHEADATHWEEDRVPVGPNAQQPSVRVGTGEQPDSTIIREVERVKRATGVGREGAALQLLFSTAEGGGCASTLYTWNE